MEELARWVSVLCCYENSVGILGSANMAPYGIIPKD